MSLARRNTVPVNCLRRRRIGSTVRPWVSACLAVLALACLIPMAVAGQDKPSPRQAVPVAQQATDGPQGVLDSVAYANVAPGLAIDVKSVDDSDLSQALRARFEAELGRAGHSSNGPPALSLDFQTQVIPGKFPDREGTLGKFEGGSEGVDLRFNLWSSSEDSLLGGQRSESRREANVLHMNVVLRDLASHKVLWQADAYGELVSVDQRQVGLAMVGPIVARIGETVREERFALE